MIDRPYTLYRCLNTKPLYYELLSNNFNVWIPTISTKRVDLKSGRTVTNTVAAIPGYLFVWYKDCPRLAAWGAERMKVGLRQMVRREGHYALPVRLTWLDIFHIKTACEEISNTSPNRPIYRIGEIVRVRIGLNVGDMGKVVRVYSKGVRLLIGTEYVGMPQQFVEKV